MATTLKEAATVERIRRLLKNLKTCHAIEITKSPNGSRFTVRTRAIDARRRKP